MSQFKYKSVPQIVDGIYFPSKYEAQVYRILSSEIQKSPRQYRLDRQVPTTIYEGELMPKRSWKCDFAITDLVTGRSVLIEAKGMIPREFSYVINLLASNNQRAFTNLVVVSENREFNSKYWGKLTIKNCNALHNYLERTLGMGIYGGISL